MRKSEHPDEWIRALCQPLSLYVEMQVGAESGSPYYCGNLIFALIGPSTRLISLDLESKIARNRSPNLRKTKE